MLTQSHFEGRDALDINSYARSARAQSSRLYTGAWGYMHHPWIVVDYVPFGKLPTYPGYTGVRCTDHIGY